jgi:hypothetical protein
MTTLLLALVLGLPAQAEEEGWALNDLGIEAELPAGWTVPEGGWADWQLKARHTDGRLLQVWSTPWQVEMDDDAAEAFETLYAEQLAKEAGAKVTGRAHSTGKLAGRRIVRVHLDLEVKGGQGAAELVAFTGPGRTVHVRMVGNARAARTLRTDLDHFVEALRFQQGPLETSAAELTGKDVAIKLPDGWRAPVGPEAEEAKSWIDKIGATLVPSDCFVGVKPQAVGAPQLLLGCPSSLRMGVLDEHSFAAEEAELHGRLFGRSEASGATVPPAEQVQVGDRVGLLYRPPASSLAVRMALAPMGSDAVQLWALGPTDAAADLDAALMEALPRLRFTDPTGGAHVVGIDKKVGYYLSHRPTSPLVLGPAGLVLALGIGGIALSRRRKDPFADDED